MDIILVSNGRTKYLQNITKHAIESCKASSNLINFNFIIIEQDKKAEYEGANTIHYNFEFNYNKCLNLGLKYSTSKYVALCNNDLNFKFHWAENIILAMGDTYLSASPALRKMDKPPAEGYTIGQHITGWCIVINRQLIDVIGGFDEGVRFWYSDNIYGDQLKAKKIKHILVYNSSVQHLVSLTLKVSREARELMGKQYKAYSEARKKYYK